jgi:diketogulonate reductase-like aldo/keto reductase
MKVTGYSPLATGKILDDEDIVAVARRYGRSVA